LLGIELKPRNCNILRKIAKGLQPILTQNTKHKKSPFSPTSSYNLVESTGEIPVGVEEILEKRWSEVERLGPWSKRCSGTHKGHHIFYSPMAGKEG